MNDNKKKVAVITRHAIANYGSLLQAYALQTAIEKSGYSCEIIDYIRHDEDYHRIADTLLKKAEKWNKNILTRLVYKCIQAPEHYIMGYRFEKYRAPLLNLSDKRYSSGQELLSDPPKADIYCTGSDQVWGAIGTDAYDKAYFLSFVSKDNTQKAAYAASFGKSDLSTASLEEMKLLLEDYNTLTLREKSAVELLDNMGVKNSGQVLDPTLLLDSSQWSQLIEKEEKKRYVLLYQLHSNSDMDRYAAEFAKRCNLPLIRLTPLLHRAFKGGRVKYLPRVSEFLSYIKNAEYMITDSFHGTAFAINFNTQFVDILPGETKTRNQSILELTNLTDRVLEDYNDFSFIEKKIDFCDVNSIIENERKKSLALLEDILK